MGERGEIAASADRALRGDDGVHAAIQHQRERLGDQGADAAVAERERVGAQGHDDARLRFGERLAEAAGVAADEIELEAIEFVIGDADFAEFAEAGVDAVDGARSMPVTRRTTSRECSIWAIGGLGAIRSCTECVRNGGDFAQSLRGCPLSSSILAE